MLLNLITNAVESMADEDGPRILSVKCEVQDGGGVMVSIADTGAGIGAQDAARIFNPLFTTKSGGMGMGLSICRSIIEAHDGHLVVAPNTPRGAVFQFVPGRCFTGIRRCFVTKSKLLHFGESALRDLGEAACIVPGQELSRSGEASVAAHAAALP